MQTMHPTESLRDRKRREAKRATQRVAIELCLEHGVDAVTVEMICDRAGISPRTFYNYFGSREAAVLGGERPAASEEQVAAFIARDGVSDVEAFASLMAQVWVEAEPDREIFRLRRRLLDASPELAGLNWNRINESRTEYAQTVRLRLAARQPDATPEDLDTESALVVALAMGTLQVIARGWAADDGDTDLESLIHDFFPRVRRLTQATPASLPTA